MKRKQKTTGIWILLMGIFITGLLFKTWCRVQCVNAGYELSLDTQHNRELMRLQNKLKIELAHLKSPDRIATIAQEQLGLVSPSPEQVMTIP
jgi:cell division protein FtsL